MCTGLQLKVGPASGLICILCIPFCLVFRRHEQMLVTFVKKQTSQNPAEPLDVWYNLGFPEMQAFLHGVSCDDHGASSSCWNVMHHKLSASSATKLYISALYYQVRLVPGTHVLHHVSTSTSFVSWEGYIHQATVQLLHVVLYTRLSANPGDQLAPYNTVATSRYRFSAAMLSRVMQT